MFTSLPRLQSLLPSMLMLLLSLNLHACSRAGGESVSTAVPLYSDVLVREVSIEDDPSLDDFQIVSPDGIGVDAEGNIYLADESSVKVYRPDGSPLKLIGREGSGPGEFEAPLSVDVGPTGCIAAMDILWEANVYAPDGEFLRRSRYRNEAPFRSYLQEQGFTFTMMNSVVAIDEQRLLIDLFALNNTLPGPYVGSAQLLYTTPDTLIELCRYVNYRTVQIDENSNTSAEFQGGLLWALLDADRLLYTETRLLRSEGSGHDSYDLIVLDLAAMSTDTLSVPWVPEPIPPAVKELKPHYSEFLNMHFEVEPVMKQIMDDTRIYPPLKALRTDGGMVFGFHFSPTDSVERDFEDEDLAVEPHLVDIVDLESGRLLARAEFPFLPEVIRDGRAYRLYTPDDDFPAIHVYRIDPLLYALRGERN